MKYKKLSILISVCIFLVSAGVIAFLIIKWPKEEIIKEEAVVEQESGPYYPTPESVTEAYFWCIVYPYAYDFRQDTSVMDIKSVQGLCFTNEMYEAFNAYTNLMATGYATEGRWTNDGITASDFRREKNRFLTDSRIYDSRFDYEKGSDTYYFDLMFMEFVYMNCTHVSLLGYDYAPGRDFVTEVKSIDGFQITSVEDWDNTYHKYGSTVPDGQGGVADADSAIGDDNAYLRLLGLEDYQIPEGDEFKKVNFSYEVETYDGQKFIDSTSVLTVRYGDEWYVYFHLCDS